MKGLTIDECVEKAEEIISQQGQCLLLFDVKGSRKVPDRNKLTLDLIEMIKDISTQFDEYFPENTLAVYGRQEKGFMHLLGDASWTGINSSEAIPKIVQYQRENYPEIPLAWGVAIDGYDQEGMKLVK